MIHLVSIKDNEDDQLPLWDIRQRVCETASFLNENSIESGMSIKGDKLQFVFFGKPMPTYGGREWNTADWLLDMIKYDFRNIRVESQRFEEDNSYLFTICL